MALDHHPETRHEEDELPVRPFLYFLAGMVVVLIVVGIVCAAIVLYFTQPEPGPVAREREDFPPPRLQVAPPLDMRHLRAREERLLSNYQWIDQDAGVVRIPIEQAMEQIARRGSDPRQLWPDEDPQQGKAGEQPAPEQKGQPPARSPDPKSSDIRSTAPAGKEPPNTQPAAKERERRSPDKPPVKQPAPSKPAAKQPDADQPAFRPASKPANTNDLP